MIDSIKQTIAAHSFVEAAELEPDVRLHELGIDSLAAVELAMELEDNHSIELVDEAMEQWVTVGDVIRTVQEAQA